MPVIASHLSEKAYLGTPKQRQRGPSKRRGVVAIHTSHAAADCEGDLLLQRAREEALGEEDERQADGDGHAALVPALHA